MISSDVFQVYDSVIAYAANLSGILMFMQNHLYENKFVFIKEHSIYFIQDSLAKASSLLKICQLLLDCASLCVFHSIFAQSSCEVLSD